MCGALCCWVGLLGGSYAPRTCAARHHTAGRRLAPTPAAADSQDFFSQDDEYESDGLAPEYSDEEDEEGEERGSSSGEESGESSGREAAPERPARRQRQEGGYHS